MKKLPILYDALFTGSIESVTILPSVKFLLITTPPVCVSNVCPTPRNLPMPLVNRQSPVSKPTTLSKPKAVGKPGGSIIDQIKPIGFDDDDGIKMLVYGKSGTGKTTFVATFDGPILWIVCSGSDKPGELRSVDTPEYRKKIKQVTLTNSTDLRVLIDYVKASGLFKTVVLDHATGLADLILKEILGLTELPAQKAWGLASQQQYGQLALQCKEMFRALLNLQTNVVIIAQERQFGGKDDGSESELITPTVGAALTPSVTGWLNPACDYVVQTYIRPKMTYTERKLPNGQTVKTSSREKGVEYCLRTEAHDIFLTKFRIPRGKVLPECITDPTWTKVKKLIKGE